MATKRGPDKDIGQKYQFTFAIYIMKWDRALQKSTATIPNILRLLSTGT